MQPGINRAVPMGILGFALGAALLLLIRFLQNMDPVWDNEIGLIMAGVMSAVFFLWGIGAFDPRLSEHHAEEPPEDVDDSALAHYEAHDHHEEELTETAAVTSTIWTVSFWLIVLVVGLAAFAWLPGGFGLTISNDPAADFASIGTLSFSIGDLDIQMTQLTAFVMFTVFTLGSLLVAALAIGMGMTRLGNSIQQVKKEQPAAKKAAKALPAQDAPALPDGIAAEEAEPAAPAAPPVWRQRLVAGVKFAVVFGILYVLFYEVLIGLILPTPLDQRFILTVVNALLFAVIIVFPRQLVRFIGNSAGWLARELRRLPAGLGQR